MNLSQLLTRIARGPAGGLAVCGASSGTIPAEHIPRIVETVQDVLRTLHQRFPLQTKVLTLAVVDGIFDYPLRAEFAQSSGSAEINKFIVDSVAKPFTGDVLAIEHVLDANQVEIPLNDRRDPVSWFTSSYDTLGMDYPVSGDTYFIQYRADHAPLTVEFDVLDPTALTAATQNQKIYIPSSLLDALLAKIAYELYCNQEGDVAAAKEQQLLVKYESICAELEGRNTLNNSTVEDRDDRFKREGWT